jgi:VanZ family protein
MKSKNLHVGNSGLSPEKSWLEAWWPALLIAAAIFAASSTRGSSLPGRLPAGTDKLVHALVYGLLGATVARALLLRSGGLLSGRALAASAGLALAYGLSDEIHQLFVPGRSFELADLAADGLGAALGALLTIRRFRQNRAALPSRPAP